MARPGSTSRKRSRKNARKTTGKKTAPKKTAPKKTARKQKPAKRTRKAAAKGAARSGRLVLGSLEDLDSEAGLTTFVEALLDEKPRR
jgi:hypothetical protein